MSRQSGFVPIQFHIAGKLLLVLSGIGLLAAAVAKLTAWFAFPSMALIMSLIAIPIGLYLVLVAPRE